MAQSRNRKSDAVNAMELVIDSGGKIVGRTRLQKLAYLLEFTGLGSGIPFEYRHYGPYSEELADAVEEAVLLDLLGEEEHDTSWGGFYSIYTSNLDREDRAAPVRTELATIAIAADPVELELAATAVYLAAENEANPWEETARRKPDKIVGGRLENAKLLYHELQSLKTPNRLPEIA